MGAQIRNFISRNQYMFWCIIRVLFTVKSHRRGTGFVLPRKGAIRCNPYGVRCPAIPPNETGHHFYIASNVDFHEPIYRFLRSLTPVHRIRFLLRWTDEGLAKLEQNHAAFCPLSAGSQPISWPANFHIAFNHSYSFLYKIFVYITSSIRLNDQ